MKFNHKKYTYHKPFNHERHKWELVGPKGGVHFHATVNPEDEYDTSCGLEFHHCEPPEYMKDQAPGHINCWLTGGRCWHDGTSLYAKELWERYKLYLRDHEHEYIFNSLESEYVRVFDGDSED